MNPSNLANNTRILVCHHFCLMIPDGTLCVSKAFVTSCRIYCLLIKNQKWRNSAVLIGWLLSLMPGISLDTLLCLSAQHINKANFLMMPQLQEPNQKSFHCLASRWSGNNSVSINLLVLFGISYQKFSLVQDFAFHGKHSLPLILSRGEFSASY